MKIENKLTLSSTTSLTSPTGSLFDDISEFRIVKSENEEDDDDSNEQTISEEPSFLKNVALSPKYGYITEVELNKNTAASVSKMNEENHRAQVIASLARARNATTPQQQVIKTRTERNSFTVTPSYHTNVERKTYIATKTEDNDFDTETEVSEMTEEELSTIDEESMDAKEFVFDTSLKTKKNKKRNHTNNMEAIKAKKEPPVSSSKKPKHKQNTTSGEKCIKKKIKGQLSKSMDIGNYFKKASIPPSSSVSSKNKSTINFSISRNTLSDRFPGVSSDSGRNETIIDSGKQSSTHLYNRGGGTERTSATLVEDSSESDINATLVEDDDDFDPISSVSSVKEPPMKAGTNRQFQRPLLNSTEIENSDGTKCHGESFLPINTKSKKALRPLSLSLNSSIRPATVAKTIKSTKNKFKGKETSQHLLTQPSILSRRTTLSAATISKNESKQQRHPCVSRSPTMRDVDPYYTSLFPSLGQTVDKSLENCIDDLVDSVPDDPSIEVGLAANKFIGNSLKSTIMGKCYDEYLTNKSPGSDFSNRGHQTVDLVDSENDEEDEVMFGSDHGVPSPPCDDFSFAESQMF